MPTHSQFAKFAVVGLLSNGILYLAYLLLTYLGVGPKAAVSILFAVGVTQTFLVNRGWTFRYAGNPKRAYIRYWAAYGIGYILNIAMLDILVDVMGYPHRVVQGLLVLLIAGFLFLLQKFWVFTDVTPCAHAELARPDHR